MVEFFLGTFAIAGRAPALAQMAEEAGWDGLALSDSQNLHGDTFAALALAAHATRSLCLMTGATNPATRHPAVVAAAIATIQAESGGRAILGIARGDSALAYLGRRPMPLVDFERGLEHVQTYLNGEAVDCDGFPSRLMWLLPPKVPMDVAAKGRASSPSPRAWRSALRSPSAPMKRACRQLSTSLAQISRAHSRLARTSTRLLIPTLPPPASWCVAG